MFPRRQRELFLSRSTIVYLVMLVVLVGGLWTVLAIGGHLDAPEDLAGTWTIQSAAGPVDLNVEQSGRYFELTFGKRPAVDLKRVGPTQGATHLAGGKWTVDFAPGDSDETRVIHITGPTPIDGVARRVKRRYPVDTAGAGGGDVK
jgi:hypothetical protein